jgi:hypothetical protein
MLIRRLHHLHRGLILAALTIALVATGFAHRMPTQQDDALAFVIANGGLSDICGEVPGDSHATADCLACQISGTADVPHQAQTLIDLELAFEAAVITPRESRALSRVFDPANRPQGPPVA